uniref:Uncharacterized protein n=1 Tax=Oryza punctata TaxID=4537 RepID=A0A0E0KRE8_ORYPU
MHTAVKKDEGYYTLTPHAQQSIQPAIDLFIARLDPPPACAFPYRVVAPALAHAVVALNDGGLEEEGLGLGAAADDVEGKSEEKVEANCNAGDGGSEQERRAKKELI